MVSTWLRTTMVALAAAAAVAAMGPSASAQTPFFKGKRLTLMINFAPGGPTDIEGRLLARHLAKHIEGEPTIIVQNKDGAGGMVGASYIGEAAPRDGSMFGYLTAASWRAVIEPEVYRVDFRTYEFIGFQPGNQVYYVRSDLPPGIKQAADILKARDLVAGGLAFDTSKDLLIRLTLDMLGVPYRYVTGYRNSNSARLALQRGEINLHAETSPAYFSVVEPNLVKTGEAMPVWYDPTYDGETFSAPKVLEGFPALPFPEFYRRAKGTLPSGPLWDAYRTNLATDQAMLRTVVMPPGAPAAAVEALRSAIARLNTDKDYAEEALRAIQFVPHYETGSDLNARVRKAMAVSPEIRSFVAEYTKSGNK